MNYKSKIVGILLVAGLCSAIPTDPKTITITLSPEKWNTVITGLNELPGKVGTPVINEILAQATKQMNDTIKK